MEFSPRILAFLQYEMREIKNDRDRPQEERTHASTVLGRIEGEIEWEEEQCEFCWTVDESVFNQRRLLDD